MLVFNFIISIKQSSVIDYSLFPAFSSSKNLILASSTFTNWNLFPFDSLNLFNASIYLDGLFRVLGSTSPINRKCISHDMDNDDNDNDVIITNTSDIKATDALTPSLGPIKHNDNIADTDNDDDDDDDFFI